MNEARQYFRRQLSEAGERPGGMMAIRRAQQYAARKDAWWQFKNNRLTFEGLQDILKQFTFRLKYGDTPLEFWLDKLHPKLARKASHYGITGPKTPGSTYGTWLYRVWEMAKHPQAWTSSSDSAEVRARRAADTQARYADALERTRSVLARGDEDAQAVKLALLSIGQKQRKKSRAEFQKEVVHGALRSELMRVKLPYPLEPGELPQTVEEVRRFLLKHMDPHAMTDTSRLAMRESKQHMNEARQYFQKRLPLAEAGENVPGYSRARSVGRSCLKCIFYERIASTVGDCTKYDSRVDAWGYCPSWTPTVSESLQKRQPLAEADTRYTPAMDSAFIKVISDLDREGGTWGRDAAYLRKIRSALWQGDYIEAERLTLYADTAVREMIPAPVWRMIKRRAARPPVYEAKQYFRRLQEDGDVQWDYVGPANEVR